MNAREAAEALADVELVPCVEGPLTAAKEIIALCHQADIPAVLDREACEKPDCVPKIRVMVREADLGRVTSLMRERWEQAIEGEGLGQVSPARYAPATEPEGEPPCPACGTAAALVEGACSDCGLQLE